MNLKGRSERIWDQKHQKRLNIVRVDPPKRRRADAVSAFSLCSCMAFAESGRVTCTGMLVPLELSPKADWRLTVIYDAQGYTCLVDWGRAGHDPLGGSGCKPGSDC
jgi:hypothetical protein